MSRESDPKGTTWQSWEAARTLSEVRTGAVVALCEPRVCSSRPIAPARRLRSDWAELDAW